MLLVGKTCTWAVRNCSKAAPGCSSGLQQGLYMEGLGFIHREHCSATCAAHLYSPALNLCHGTACMPEACRATTKRRRRRCPGTMVTHTHATLLPPLQQPLQVPEQCLCPSTGLLWCFVSSQSLTACHQNMVTS